MSKLADLIADLAALDAASQPSKGEADARQALATAEVLIETQDAEHADRLHALDELRRVEIAKHHETRAALAARARIHAEEVAAEIAHNAPAQGAAVTRAQEIATKYGKPLSELRQIVKDAS